MRPFCVNWGIVQFNFLFLPQKKKQKKSSLRIFEIRVSAKADPYILQISGCDLFVLIVGSYKCIVLFSRKKVPKTSWLRIFEIRDCIKDEFLQTSNIRMPHFLLIRDCTMPL